MFLGGIPTTFANRSLLAPPAIRSCVARKLDGFKPSSLRSDVTYILKKDGSAIEPRDLKREGQLPTRPTLQNGDLAVAAFTQMHSSIARNRWSAAHVPPSPGV